MGSEPEFLILKKVKAKDTRCTDCKYADLSFITSVPASYYCKITKSVQPRFIGNKEIVCSMFKAKIKDWDV